MQSNQYMLIKRILKSANNISQNAHCSNMAKEMTLNPGWVFKLGLKSVTWRRLLDMQISLFFSWLS